MKSKKNKLTLLFFIVVFGFGFFVLPKISAVKISAQEAGPNVWGESGEVQGYVEQTGLSKQDPRITVVKIIRIFLGFLGIIAVLIILYAGYLWMTAGGNEDQISRAKKLLINAVIGLIIILSSFAIASFALSKLIGATGGGDGGGGDGGGGGGVVSCADPYVAQSGLCQDEACKEELATTPHVCRLSPASGPKGTYVTIFGYHFDTYAEGSKVKFGNTEAEIVSCPGNNQINWTDNRIVVKVPEVELGLYPVSVTNKIGKTNKLENQKTFTVTDEKVPPGIACILPGEGKENTDVIVYGDNFGDSASKVIFKDEAEAAIKTWTKIQIDTSVPQGALTGDVFVRVIETEMVGEELVQNELESNGYPFKVTCSSGNECSLSKCCSNNLCVSGNKCKGGEGESCDLGGEQCSDEKCNEGLYCADCLCKKLPGPGEACAEGCGLEGKCAPGLMCDANCKCAQSTNPVIESIKPLDGNKVPNGAPGNLITLQGKNFGSVQKAFENQLSNVDFETGEVGKTPKDWAAVTELHTSVGISKDFHRSGSQSVRLHRDNNINYPGTCTQAICNDLKDVRGCTWLEATEQCRFTSIDNCHPVAPAFYNKGEALCWPNTNRTVRLKLTYNVAPLKWQVGEKYAMKFYYRGASSREVNLRLGYDVIWPEQCVSFTDTNAKFACDDMDGEHVGYPTCQSQAGYCCLHDPKQQKCYGKENFPNIAAGNYDDWTLYSATFTYTEEMSKWVDKNGKLHNEIGLVMVDTSTGAQGTDLYIDDFSIARVPKAGGVVFLGDPANENDDAFALFPGELNSLCESTWESNQIIVVVPDGAKDGPVEVIAENGTSDRTDDGNGPKISDFDVNTTVRPGLCAAYKLAGNTRMNEGKFKEEMTLAGMGLTNIDNKSDIFFGDEKNAFNPYTGPDEISPEKKNIYVEGIGIPDLGAGQTSVYVVDNNEMSNPVNFKILNSSIMPQISGFEPENGHSGDYVTIFGSGFGKEQGQVFFNFAEKKEANYLFPQECLGSIWKDSQILVKVPAGVNLDSGTLTVRTKNNLEAQSSKNFSVGDYCSKNNAPCPEDKSCGANGVCITSVKPGLCKIDPANGHEGTKVNFYGENFGSVQGKAEFSLKNGVGSVNTTKWEIGGGGKADKASSTAPVDLASGLVKIINSQELKSNGLQFGVMNCIINGQADDTKCAGENVVCCPANSYFAGSCLAKEGCGSGVTGPTDYAWSFSTESPSDDLICRRLKDEESCATNENPACCWDAEKEGDKCRRSGTCGKALPLVLEKCAYTKEQETCATNASGPSPSPWSGHQTGDACVDSVIRAEFNVKMDKATINSSSVIVKQCSCNVGEECEFKDTTCNADVAGDLAADEMEFEFIPSANLTANKWYKVTLKGGENGIKSQDGVVLDGDKDGNEGGDYEWNFKTRSSDKACEASCPAVTPAEYRAIDKTAVKYNGNVTAKENACLFLNRSFAWNWSTSEDTKAEGAKKAKLCANGTDGCLCCVDNAETEKNECDPIKTDWACVMPLQETGSEPVNVMGKINDLNEGDFGKLYIDFEDFKVIETQPPAGCDVVCLNAVVGVIFNNPVDEETVSSDNLKFYKCADKDCFSYSLLTEGGIRIEEKAIQFNIPALEKSAYYRVILKGGNDGVKNAKGGELSGLNYNTAGNNLITNYSFEDNLGDWEISHGQRDSARAYTGKFALMIGESTTENYALKPSLKANNKYQLSGWIYNSIEDGEASLNLKIGEKGCSAATSGTKMNKWQEVKCEYVPSENEEAALSIKFSGTGYIWVDDIELKNIGGTYNAFSWVFKTGDKECAVNSVSVEPHEAIVNKIGASALFLATPYSTPNKCNPNGQILNAFSYNWNWQPQNNSSIEISSYPACGNGILEKGEACDDGNILNGDGCSDKCIWEGTGACTEQNKTNCCGNKIVEPGEACDGGEGCDAKCVHQGANAYYGSYCGDNKVGKGEDCDDGNKNPGDGCSAACLYEGTVKTKIGPSQAVKFLEGPVPPATELSVDISAEEPVSKKKGTANFKLLCGYKYGGEDDAKCGPNMGVGYNGCCYERPQVLYPYKDQKDFCRNGTFEAIFSQKMDAKQVKDAEILKRNLSGESCSEDVGMSPPQRAGDGGKSNLIAKADALKSLSTSLIKSFINIFIDNSLLAVNKDFWKFPFGGMNILAYNGNSFLKQGFSKVARLFNATLENAYAVFCPVKQKISSWNIKEDAAEILYKDMLLNSSFEEGNVGAAPQNWTRIAWPKASAGISNEEARSGQQSIKLHQNQQASCDGCVGSAWANHVTIQQDVSNLNWQVGEEYEIKFYYKGVAANTVYRMFGHNTTDFQSFCSVPNVCNAGDTPCAAEFEGAPNYCCLHEGSPYSASVSYSSGSCCFGSDRENNNCTGKAGEVMCACKAGEGPCVDDPTKCCKNYPVQKGCFSYGWDTVVPSGGGEFNDWQEYSSTFVYSDAFNMNTNVSKTDPNYGKRQNIVGVIISYANTLDKGTDFYIDDFTITKKRNEDVSRDMTLAIIQPNALLNPSSSYQLDFTGLKNEYGVAVKGSPKINITTGNQICTIDHVDVTVVNTSPLASTTNDIFLCAGRNDCGKNTESVKDDDASTDMPGNQHLYTAQAADKNGTYLTADYLWSEKDPDNAISLKSDNLPELQKWIEASPVQDTEAILDIGAYNPFWKNDHATTTVNVKIFMCQNPWPSIEEFPYGDNEYNFSTYYCRDNNDKNNSSDDLPNIGSNPPDPICSKQGGPACKENILKEYLWVEDK